MQDLRYPIGQYKAPEPIATSDIKQWIEAIKQLPALLKTVVGPLNDTQLNTPYRPDGWTVRQLVHHIADSHINAYIRFKLALTEDQPTIKPYDQDAWAQMIDSETVEVDISLQLIDLLHFRWVRILSALTDKDYAREFIHPELGKIRLDWNIGLYAWHSRHHLAHITELIKRENWS